MIRKSTYYFIKRGGLIIAALFLYLNLLCSTGIGYDLTGIDDILDRSHKIMNQAQNATIPEWLKETINRKVEKRYIKEAEQIMNSVDINGKSNVKKSKDKEGKILIFLTFGKEPERDENIEKNRKLIRDIFSISPDAIVVVRGLPKGSKNLGDFYNYLKKITITKDGKLPKIYLDPVRFRQYNIHVAPTILYEIGNNRKNRQKIAWARGSISSTWIKKEVEKNNQRGDLGKVGPTTTIAERDLIEELKERLQKIDWEEKKKKIIANYWKKRRYVELPEATRDKTFYISGKFRVKKDLILPNGQVLANKGEIIDQFKYIKPTFVLLVFDPGNEKQIKWAIKQNNKYKNNYRVRYIITKLPDIEHGWESLNSLYNKLNAPVFFLTNDIINRFHLKHVPSLVKPLEDQFEVQEICIRD